MKLNLSSFVSLVDPRTIALFAAVGFAFCIGIRFEMSNTERVKKEFVQYQLEQSKKLAEAQQQILNEAVASHAAVQEINENALVREEKLVANNDRLLARLDAERLRKQTRITQLPQTCPASSTTNGDTEITEPDLYGKAGKDIVSLMKEADTYLNSFADCQAYVKVIRKACE